MRTVTKIEIDTLVEIEISKNRPGYPVYQESLPKILFGKAPRSIKGKTWFIEIANSRPPIFGDHVCECCGSIFSMDNPKERHESYGLYSLKEELVIRLYDVLKICKTCHGKIHLGNKLARQSKSGIGLCQNNLAPTSILTSSLWNKANYLLIENKLYSWSELF